MVNTDILEGLRTATSRGQTLKDAMLSFFNAGYTKQEIEEAARALQLEQVQGKQQSIFQQKTSQIQQQVQPQQQKQIQQQLQQPKQKLFQQPAQKVSNYSSYEQPKPSKANSLVVILLIIVCLILIGALVAIFVYKNQVINFFTNLFGG